MAGRDLFAEAPQGRDLFAAQPVASELAPTPIAEDTGAAQSFLIGLGKGFTDIGRGVGIPVDELLGLPSQEVQQEAFGALEEQRPISAAAGEITGQALPFVPLALGAELAVPALAGQAALGTGAARATLIGTQGVIGAGEGGIIAEGTGRDPLAAAGIGGTLAASIEAVSPLAGRAISAVFRKLTGKPPKGTLVTPEGQPTPELQKALDAEDLSFDEFTNEAAENLQKTAPESAEEASRAAFLQSQGLDPTQAQITRGASEFQAQQEAVKTSTRARRAIEKQEAVLSTRFDNAVIDTLGQSQTPTSTIIDAVVDKTSVLDGQISDLYKQTRNLAAGDKNIRFDTLASTLRAKAPSNEATGGAVKAIIGDLQSRGILDDKLKVAGRIDVETAEEARKFMNSLFDAQIPFRNTVIRDLKESLDNDVFRSAGDDIFQQARRAKADFEKGLSRAGVSKFDKRKTNLVRDLLENKINPDTLIDNVVKSKTYRASDLEQLKKYTAKEAPEAWQDLRAETLQTIKDNAFKGPADDAGNQALSRAALESELKRIGLPKLKVIFEPKELKFLQDMVKVSQLREPVRGTALGKGPSAQAVAKLEKTLKDLPILGSLVDFIDVDAAGRAVVKSKPRQITRQPTQLERGLTATAATLAIPATQQE